MEKREATEEDKWRDKGKGPEARERVTVIGNDSGRLL